MESSLFLIMATSGASKGDTAVFAVLVYCLVYFGLWRLLRGPQPSPKPQEENERVRKELKGQTEEQMHKADLAKQKTERFTSLNHQASQLQQSEIRRLSWMRLARLEFLMSVSPYEFEGIVASLFEGHGYVVRQTPGSGDGGKDIVVERRGKISFVECKRFARGSLVGEPLLRAFLGAMTASGVRSGFFVTTSDFTTPAKAFGEEHNIELINGTRVAAALAKLSDGTDDPTRYNALCPACGNNHSFPLTSERCQTTCQCGGTIPFPLAIADLTSHIARQNELSCPKCSTRLRRSSNSRVGLLCPNIGCDFTFSGK